MNRAYALHASSHRNGGGDGSRATRPLGAAYRRGRLVPVNCTDTFLHLRWLGDYCEK